MLYQLVVLAACATDRRHPAQHRKIILAKFFWKSPKRTGHFLQALRTYEPILAFTTFLQRTPAPETGRNASLCPFRARPRHRPAKRRETPFLKGRALQLCCPSRKWRRDVNWCKWVSRLWRIAAPIKGAMMNLERFPAMLTANSKAIVFQGLEGRIFFTEFATAFRIAAFYHVRTHD